MEKYLKYTGCMDIPWWQPGQLQEAMFAGEPID